MQRSQPMQVRPTSAQIKVGGTQPFIAFLPVTWSIAAGGSGGGSIDQNGLYTNVTAGMDIVLATPKDPSYAAVPIGVIAS